MAPWERIHNPYIVGNPIKGAQLFFGRDDDFAFVKTKFTGGKEGGLIVLCGARRSGKTSILFQILDGRLGPEFLPVLVDMQSMAIVNDRQFVRRIVELIDAAAGIAAPNAAPTGDTPFSDLEDYVDEFTRALGNRRLIIAFDEYELIETAIDSGTVSPQLLRTLANLVEHRQVFIVFTGSEKLEERSKKYWDIFLSKALHRRISFLSKQDTLRLITEPVANVVEYAPGVRERIYDLTAGQPFYTQVICQSIIDHLNDAKKRRVEMEDVEQAVEEVIQNPLPQMIFHWNALGDLQKLSLAIIAELTRRERRPVTAAEMLAFARTEKIGYQIDANALNKALDRLFHGDLVHYSSSPEGYEFKMDLWRLWAMRMHSVWQVINEVEVAGGFKPDNGITRVARRSKRRRALSLAIPAIGIFAAGVLLWRILNLGGSGNDERSQAGVVSASHAGVLSVSTTPSGAGVRVDGVLSGETPATVTLTSGKHDLLVELPGYRDGRQNVSITDGDTVRVAMTLEQLHGAILVQTTPGGARVSVDGGPTRPSPVTFKELAVGQPHHVTVSLEGYETASYDVRAIADSTITFSHSFAQRTAPLAISSDPPGAAVTLDGHDAGKTPFATTSIPFGSHDVSVALGGHKTWSGRISVPAPNNLVELSLVRLAPGTISFSVSPYGDVYVDGRRIAQAVTFYQFKADAGKHTVELRNPQFKAFSQEVVVAPDSTLRVQHAFSE